MRVFTRFIFVVLQLSKTKKVTQLMTVSMEMVRMVKFRPRNNQSERSDLPQLTILPYKRVYYSLAVWRFKAILSAGLRFHSHDIRPGFKASKGSRKHVEKSMLERLHKLSLHTLRVWGFPEGKWLGLGSARFMLPLGMRLHRKRHPSRKNVIRYA